MSNININTKRNKLILLIILTMFFAIISFLISPVFETNDDRVMMDIITGKYGEKYSAYSVFMGYPISFILSRLYMLLPNIPWYGILFCGIIVYSAWIVLTDIAKKAIESKNKWISWGIFIVTLIIYINVFLVQQFTIISSILALTAMYKIMKKDSWIGIVIICFLSYEIRSNAFFMAMPFIGLGILWDGLKNRKISKSNIIGAGSIALIIIIGIGVNKIAYSSAEWKEYLAYNSERSKLYDYNTFCNSNVYKEKCLQSGISEDEYYIMNTYSLLLDKNISKNKIETINKVVSENKKKDNVFLKLIKVIYYDIKNSFVDFRRYTLVMIFADIMFFWVLKKEKSKLLLWLLSLMGRYIIISYLVWIARLPNRVYFSLFLLALVFNFYIIIENSDKVIVKKTRCWVVCIIVAAMFITANTLKTHNQLSKHNYEYQEVNNYCKNNPENLYMLSIDKYFDVTDNVLSNTRTEFTYVGTWLANSPIVNGYLCKYKSEDLAELLLKGKGFYILNKNSDIESVQQYMNSRFNGVEVKKIDSINQNYYVYKFIKKLK